MKIHYKLVRKKNLKRMYLRVLQDLSVEIRASNQIPKQIIDEFVLSKTDWIQASIDSMLAKRKAKKELNNNLFYMGKKYPICFAPDQDNTKERVSILDNKVIIAFPEWSERVNPVLDSFYKEEAKRIISPMVDAWSIEMKLLPNKIGFRKNKTRWGSCSWENNLSFNYLLVKLPISIIEYIVIHEIAHIKHKNHSINFWKLVEKYVPEYQELRRSLRKYEKIIF